MIIIREGHRYALENFDGEGKPQVLRFIEKMPTVEEPTKLVTVYNGTTNEEVLRVLINRLQHLNGKMPCRENSIVIQHLETALLWVEKRQRDRAGREVLSTTNP